MLSICEKYDEVIEALELLCGVSENMDTRGAAQANLKSKCDFSFVGFLLLWSSVLVEVDNTQRYLQEKAISLESAVVKLQALKMYLSQQRESIAKNALQNAIAKCDKYGISTERRVRRKKNLDGETSKDAALSYKAELRKMLSSVDRFIMELSTRFEGLNSVHETFCYCSKLQSFTRLIRNTSKVSEKILQRVC